MRVVFPLYKDYHNDKDVIMSDASMILNRNKEYALNKRGLL